MISVTNRSLKNSLSCLVAVAAFGVSSAAYAQEPPPAQYSREPAKQEYVTPLYQQTQPSYVPQSVAMSGPREINNWNEGEPIPPGYRPVERTRKGLIIGGVITFGSLWMLSAMVAAANGDANKGKENPAAALYVPAVGPFIQMGSADSSTARLFLGIDGVAQCAGLAMFIVGLASPRTVLVRNDLAQNDKAEKKEEPKPEVKVLPLFGGVSGAGVVGTF